ncbi:COQ9 family protein [Falsiroseomonas selenitidurans]|uniref:COQ9 family protein n=1 Tax=Falsiroseomonas selenitidurans TaxID=2716335 RepID=A0ABX1EE43_9PROT|nr:COQ9 family protein [Falsiroseomonas selenitidurans]NKC34167.1 COQ9 family protein [Falsiroseomonas selenitidurans]
MIERSEDRDQAVQAALPHVPALGWTRAALGAGLRDLGRDPLEQDWLFPRGPVEAIECWLDLADRQMEEAAPPEAMAALKIPRRIRHLLLLRLQQARPHRDAVRRALALQALPWNLGSAMRTAARTADAVWAAAGDTSADFSWYTRRATLAGIYGATLAFWLQDESEEQAETAAFLDRRLEGLARLQRAKPRG